MNYYYRSNEDGTFKVICTRCFITVGTVKRFESVKRLESAHRCFAKKDDGITLVSSEGDKRQALRQRHFLEVVSTLPYHYLLILVLLLLFAFPTLCEYFFFRYPSLNYPCILFGDLIGCAFLFVFLHMRRTAVILYLLLSVFESYLLAARVVPTMDILWIMDVVPTLIAVERITKLKFGNAAQLVTH
jgi:hypothetical protein